MTDDQIEQEIQAKGLTAPRVTSADIEAEIGRKIARQKAVEKVWPLLGFRLRDALARGA